MNIDSQIAAVNATTGALAIEQRMLGEAFCGPPAPTSSPGMNTTMQLELAGGEIVFHKPFSGVDVANAIAFGQTGETPPLHEAVAWQLASVLGMARFLLSGRARALADRAQRMLDRGEVLLAGEF